MPPSVRAWLACSALVAWAGCDEASTNARTAPEPAGGVESASPASSATGAADSAPRSADSAHLSDAKRSEPTAGPAPSSASTQGANADPQAPGEPADPPPPLPRGRIPSKLTREPPTPLDGAPPRGPIDVGLDGAWLRRMAGGAITRVTENQGGSTVTIRLTFEDGARAVLKADQTRSATNYRSEIAAYHVDRLLGFGRTAPVVGRRFSRAAMRAHLVHAGARPEFLARFDQELRSPPEAPDEVKGAVIAWHSERLHSLEVPRRFGEWTAPGATVPAEIAPHLVPLSELTLFDFLIDNTDRYSGGNVLRLGPRGPIIFLDNGAGFADWRAQREHALTSDLTRICRYPAPLVRALERVGPAAPASQRLGERLRRSLRKDPLTPVLTPLHLEALDRRVAQILEHTTRCTQSTTTERDGGPHPN